jgi:hypothetical protein
MPMTGKMAVLGHEYNQLIKLGIEDKLQTFVNLTSYDGADIKKLNEAMDKIIARKTQIILGPISSALTAFIRDRAMEHNIIIITMSNDPALADDRLFVFGHAPLKQFDKMMNYLLSNNYKNFINLLPQGPYALTMSQISLDMIISKNATLIRNEFYNNLPESINMAVNIVSDNVDHLNEIEANLTKAVIYISDDSHNLHLLFDSIHKLHLDKKAIIVGDNRIDINHPNVNLIFTGSLNILNSDIAKRAQNFNINHMSSMHILAYDLGSIVASYIGDDFTEDRFISRMRDNTPYVGISGNIHFIDSIGVRDYDIIKKEDNNYSTIFSNEI